MPSSSRTCLLLAAALLCTAQPPGRSTLSHAASNPAVPPPAALPTGPAALPTGPTGPIAPIATIDVDEVEIGQRGYGLSVFAGTEPERFGVEVLGVLREYNPGVSYIIVRLSGQKLEQTGVASGMSGSPVYFDDRLAGAVAFTWPAAQEPIAGITPIDAMRRLARLPSAAPSPGGERPAAHRPGDRPGDRPVVELAQLLAHRLPEDLLERELERLAATVGGGAGMEVGTGIGVGIGIGVGVGVGVVGSGGGGGGGGLQWVTSGFGDGSLGLLRRTLGAVAAGGAAPAGGVAAGGDAAADAAAGLVPGGAAAAVMVDGDLKLAATGTVTERRGDSVLAFGHPFLGLGEVRVPMASAEVITILSNRVNSFKIANLGPVVGAFDQDRLAGVHGTIGLAAPTVPMTLRIDAGQPREYRVRVAAVPQLVPTLLATTMISGLEAASYSEGSQGLDLTARFQLGDHGELLVRDGFSGSSAPLDAAQLLLSVASYLQQNYFEQVAIEGVEVELVQSPPGLELLKAARTTSAVARAGETVELRLEMAPYRGAPRQLPLTVTLPPELPAGGYTLLIGDGRSVDNARLSLEPAEATTLGRALELLRSLHSRRQLVVLGYYQERGLAVPGQLLPRLPASVRSVWTAAANAEVVHLRSAVAQMEVVEMPVPIQGMVRVELEVKPPRGEHREAGR